MCYYEISKENISFKKELFNILQKETFWNLHNFCPSSISQDYEYPNHPQSTQHQKNDRCPPPPQMLPERACEVPGCRSDSECERHKRCCYNGCIYACLESVQPPPGQQWLRSPNAAEMSRLYRTCALHLWPRPVSRGGFRSRTFSRMLSQISFSRQPTHPATCLVWMQCWIGWCSRNLGGWVVTAGC